MKIYNLVVIHVIQVCNDDIRNVTIKFTCLRSHHRMKHMCII